MEIKFIPLRVKILLKKLFESVTDEWYLHIIMPILVSKMRKKDRIRVLFLLTELASWKTEMLYLALRRHPRFDPILGITTNRENIGSEHNLIKYLEGKGYPFIWIKEDDCLVSQTHADIITFQKPYEANRHPKHLAWNNRRAIYCCFDYGLHSTLGFWNVHQRYYHICFRLFFENQSVLDDFVPLLNVNSSRLVATGVPMMDQLILPAEEFPNPWKNNDSRKRIIYAPHHTIADMHYKGIAFSTFLEYCDFMLYLADKYKDQVVFAFKPHPRLYTNLLNIWGQEKTDSYYNEWKIRENCQLEDGVYDGLFKHSSAMIHDCGSFITEYQYSHHPALYLVGENSDHSNMVSLATNSFNLHYKATSKVQIEEFIQDVVSGNDPLKKERDLHYKAQLLPPYGKTACENIINVILGEKSIYRN